MKITLLTTVLTLVHTFAISQIQLTDFELFNIGQENFLNGSDDSGGFQGEGIFLPNTYDSNYDSWSGWSISTVTDTITPGFMNQYACIAGHGANESLHYATTFVAGSSTMRLENNVVPQNISINNSTYAFLSMLNGDSFAKKFGGESGDDPDFFLLTIKAYNDGQVTPDSIDFYLADYRFLDNSMDYIIDDWTIVDLSSFGKSDSLSFTLSSSDNGAFGMNTPAYFCIDNVEINDFQSSQNNIHTLNTKLYPNPTVDKVTIESTSLINGELLIYSQYGQVVKYHSHYTIGQDIDVSTLINGIYYMKVKSDDNTQWNSSFVKK